MADKGSKYVLRLERMTDGGYVVLEDMRSYPNDGERFSFRGPLFASTTIKEALEYIKHQIEPLAPTKS